MSLPPATDICLILTAIGGVITSTIAALKANNADKKADIVQGQNTEQNKKLESIHSQVNGNLAQVKAELNYYKAIAERIRENYNPLFQEAKAQIDAEFSTGRRRFADRNSNDKE